MNRGARVQVLMQMCLFVSSPGMSMVLVRTPPPPSSPPSKSTANGMLSVCRSFASSLLKLVLMNIFFALILTCRMPLSLGTPALPTLLARRAIFLIRLGVIIVLKTLRIFRRLFSSTRLALSSFGGMILIGLPLLCFWVAEVASWF